MRSFSVRCGVGSCDKYDPQNSISACSMFRDRKTCPKSMKRLKNRKRLQRKRQDI